MRTETREYKVYTFPELSEKAKDKAHSDYLRNGDCWGWGGEAEDTMKEVEKLFHIKLKNWSIDTYRPEYPDIHFCDCFGDLWEQEERRELKGNRARAFLWNHFGHVLYKPRTKYFSHINGKRIEAVSADCVTFKSKVFATRVYDGTCPLTGFCYDCDALDPVAYFCFGTRWDDKSQKRVQDYESRTLAKDERTTVEDIIRDCVRSMFHSFIKDVEYAESREAFEDACKANGWEFLEDGTMF